MTDPGLASRLRSVAPEREWLPATTSQKLALQPAQRLQTDLTRSAGRPARPGNRPAHSRLVSGERCTTTGRQRCAARLGLARMSPATRTTHARCPCATDQKLDRSAELAGACRTNPCRYLFVWLHRPWQSPDRARWQNLAVHQWDKDRFPHRQVGEVPCPKPTPEHWSNGLRICVRQLEEHLAPGIGINCRQNLRLHLATVLMRQGHPEAQAPSLGSYVTKVARQPQEILHFV